MIPLVEDCEVPLVVEETELCSAEFVELERPDWERKRKNLKSTQVEGAVLVTLPEPLAVIEKLPVDGMPAFGSDQQ